MFALPGPMKGTGPRHAAWRSWRSRPLLNVKVRKGWRDKWLLKDGMERIVEEGGGGGRRLRP